MCDGGILGSILRSVDVMVMVVVVVVVEKW